MYDAIIIGGGAAGLAAAAILSGSGKSFVVLESGEKVGKKLAMTGDGKGNISNASVSAENYNTDGTARFLTRNAEVYEFFEDIGLKTRIIDGRIYPYSESAGTVVNLLRAKIPADKILTGVPVEKLRREDGTFTANEKFRAENVIFAAGSDATVGRDSLCLLKNFPHKPKPFYPVLTPFSTSDGAIKGLAGVRAKAALSLSGCKTPPISGEILFKDGGLSGIASMDLSRYTEPGGEYAVSVDFAPDMTRDALDAFLRVHTADGILKRVLARATERQAATDKRSVADAIKDFRVGKIRSCGKNRAQVMRGGVKLSELNGALESRFVPGLYVAGEAADVDGMCGGYNLHWAFLSGIIAAKAILTD